MAHVREVTRKTGRAYEVQWKHGGVKKQRTFSVKREADRFALRVETTIAEGESTEPLVRNTRTFCEVAEASLAASKGKLKPRTYDGYVQVYRRHVLPHLGSRRISTITNADVEQWIAQLCKTATVRKGTPLHPSTVKHAFVAANKVFRYAMKHRLISHNPATGNDLPTARRVDSFEPMFLTQRELEALAAELDASGPDGLMVRVAGYTGLRSGELQALQIRDVNLLRRTLEVRRTMVRTSEGWVEGTPKSEKSTRTVPLRQTLASQLTDYLATHPRATNPTAPLWPGRHYAGGGEWRGGLDWDKRLDYESFYRNRFRPAAERAGLKGLRFHDLRHAAASLFAASGMPIARVTRILGHADTGTMYKVYLHYFPDDFAADMERLYSFLAPRAATGQTSVATKPLTAATQLTR